MKELVEFFDHVAEHYASEPRAPDLYVDMICKQLELSPGARVLDLACCTGQLARKLAERGLRVEGVDVSTRMVEIARELDPGGRATFVEANVEEMELSAGAYSLILAFEAFHLLHDQPRAVRRLREALTGGGVLAVGWFTRPWWEPVKEDVARAFGRFGINLEWDYWSIPNFAALLEADGGFGTPSTDSVEVTRSVTVPAAVQDWMVSEIMAPLTAEQRGEIGRELDRLLTAAIPTRLYRGPSPYWIRWARRA